MPTSDPTEGSRICLANGRLWLTPMPFYVFGARRNSVEQPMCVDKQRKCIVAGAGGRQVRLTRQSPTGRNSLTKPGCAGAFPSSGFIIPILAGCLYKPLRRMTEFLQQLIN